MKKINRTILMKIASKAIINVIIVMFFYNILDQFIESATIYRWISTLVMVLILTKLDIMEASK